MLPRFRYRFRSSFVLLVLAALPRVVYSADGADLASAGFGLAKKFCYDCHGAKRNGNAQFDVSDPEGLIQSTAQYVVTGDAGASYMWQRIELGDMPPEGKPQPTEDEKATLQAWIESGAPKPARDERPFVAAKAIQASILADVAARDEFDRPHQRYFTLTHLYNDNEGVSELDLRLYRAALSKAINSLSWQPDVVLPVAIDEEQTVFRIDLRSLGWDAGVWSTIVREYPYGLDYDEVDDPAFAEDSRRLALFCQSPLPYLRGDWFAVHATRPPLYDVLVGIPETEAELERKLNVDVEKNFDADRLRRAGFAESGVSTANRLVERHPAAFGYYWKSYDFSPSNGSANLFRQPLGPAFPANRFAEAAFEHDGGEMIFSLPNGLQGYMLVNGKGGKISEGPIEVVRDLKETSGSPVVVNGISCMHCHRHGMIDLADTVRGGIAVFGEARRKALALYAEKPEMDSLLAKDRAKYLAALHEATGPFLQTGDDADRPIEQFPEPIGAVARYYQRDVGVDQAARELGIERSGDLRAAVKANPTLVQLGLGPFASGTSVKRSEWENRRFKISPFQRAAEQLQLGTPYVSLGSVGP